MYVFINIPAINYSSCTPDPRRNKQIAHGYRCALIACLLGIYQLTGLQMVGHANTPNDAIKSVSGFSQPVIITLLSLFIITKTLENSGIPRWIAQRIVNLGKELTGKSIGLFSFTSAFLSLFMNNLAASALLLPSAMEASRLTKIKPSKLLIPIAYGSLLGGAATYFTTANIILNDLLKYLLLPSMALISWISHQLEG